MSSSEPSHLHSPSVSARGITAVQSLEGLECVDCTHRKGKVRGISLAVPGGKSIVYVQLFIGNVSFLYACRNTVISFVHLHASSLHV